MFSSGEGHAQLEPAPGEGPVPIGMSRPEAAPAPAEAEPSGGKADRRSAAADEPLWAGYLARPDERPADLAEPEPALRLAQAATPAASQAVVGRVEKVSGSATALRNGVPVELHLGDPVFQGDVLQTASASAVTVKFTDGTVFGLSASARIVVNEMIYAAGSTSNSALFNILQGAVALVAGRSARTGEFAVDTPVATMGIRGTAVRIEVVESTGATKFSLMREPNGAVGSILLLDKATRSRVLATMQDARTATIIPGLGATDQGAIRITKTAAELRAESVLVRDLFQALPELRQRRGSSDDPGDDLIIPVLDLSVPADDRPFVVEVRAPVPTISTAVPGEIITPDLPTSIDVRGAAVEDGPSVDVGAALSISAFRVVMLGRLPLGVSFDRAAGRFVLDPTDGAFQSLAAGETVTIVVHYGVFDGVVTRPASVTWTVVGRNDAPVARADRLQVNEHDATVLALVANDRDLDGEGLSIARWTQPREGSVVRDRDGHLVFRPGDDFDALSAGQTATVSFTYTAVDPHGATDTQSVTLTVRGEGHFAAPAITARDDDVLPESGQAVALSLSAPSRVVTPSADLDLAIAFGPLHQRALNLVYLVDVSGSTTQDFVGAPVGDLNQDGFANTVLDAEIASLIDLTDRVRSLGFSSADVSVTLIPFNGAADPAEGGGPGATVRTFNLGAPGDQAIASALTDLASTGTTDFEQALQAAIGSLGTLDPGRSEDDVIYFLSDGAGSGTFGDELATLAGEFGAQIAGVGVGGNAQLDVLDLIDNTGGAIRIDTTGALELAPLGHPFLEGDVLDIDVFVNGREIPDVGPEDLLPSGSGLTLEVSASELQRFAGDRNSIVATVTVTGGVTLTASLEVHGALPRSTDLDL